MPPYSLVLNAIISHCSKFFDDNDKNNDDDFNNNNNENYNY